MKLVFISVLVLLGTVGWYLVTEQSGGETGYFDLLNADVRNGENAGKENLQVADSAVVNDAQYATGAYTDVYNFIQTVSKVDNRGLQMNIGKDGYYQMINRDDNRNFNVLQMTDLHITGSEASYKQDIQAIDTVYTMIQRAEPDFIVLTGDVIFGTDGYDVNDGMRALNVICKLMDRIGIPWTWTFGNHDHSFLDQFSSDTIASMLAQSTTLKMYRDDTAVSGYTNGVFELCNSNGTVAMGLVVLDSGNIIQDESGSSLGYDYIRDDQVEWYARQIGKLNTLHSGNVKTMLFFHIPIQEYETAWEEGSPVFGNKREPVDDSQMKSKIFDRAVELQSTVAMFCGHDHLNDYGIFYRGIELVYSKSVDYIAYPGIAQKTEQRGATLITVDSGGAYAITPMQFQF